MKTILLWLTYLLILFSYYELTFVVKQPLNTQTVEVIAMEKQKETMPLCSNSSVKTYMDYKMITDKRSNQYRYIKEHMTIKDGFLYNGEYMGVALGSYFGKIGSKYTFVLDTGIELKVVKIDEKADKHTFGGCQQRWDKSVIEIVIDSNTIKVWKGSNGYYANGNFNNLEQFKGKIISIIKE